MSGTKKLRWYVQIKQWIINPKAGQPGRFGKAEPPGHWVFIHEQRCTSQGGAKTYTEAVWGDKLKERGDDGNYKYSAVTVKK